MKLSSWRCNKYLACSSSGFVLVMVLWLLVLLSMIAMHLSLITRTETKLSVNLLSHTRLSYAADAGVNWAVINLSLDPESRWLADSSLQLMMLGDIEVEVRLQDENGKFDLNQTGQEQLERLFIAAGVEPEKSNFLANAVLDWRDQDQLRRLNGAEDDDYIAAGLSYEAKDAEFESITELRQILGMEEWIFGAISGAVTVYSRQRQINPQVAPRLVLLAFPNATGVAVDQYILKRRERHDIEQPAPAPPEFIDKFLPPTLQGVYYTIHTKASEAEHAQAFKDVVIRKRTGPLGNHEVQSIRIPIPSEGTQQREE